nr:ORF2 [Torque teno felis virus]QYD02162.1 ORF2 [Torque teno felis virus]QYD02168.1 ORF2 [Torque teno felis virus]
MEPPLPGPNLLLPALSLSGPPNLDHHLAYKRREAQWKRLVSDSHKEWCLCGSYKNHFLSPDKPLLKESCSEKEDASEQGGDGAEASTFRAGEDITDEDIILAAGGDGQ